MEEIADDLEQAIYTMHNLLPVVNAWIALIYPAIMLGLVLWLVNRSKISGSRELIFGFSLLFLTRLVVETLSIYVHYAYPSDKAYPRWFTDTIFASDLIRPVGTVSVIIGFWKLCVGVVRSAGARVVSAPVAISKT